jgi:hypothetical protein
MGQKAVSGQGEVGSAEEIQAGHGPRPKDARKSPAPSRDIPAPAGDSVLRTWRAPKSTEGTPEYLRRVVWYAVAQTRQLISDRRLTFDQRIRALHALAGVANAFVRVLEMSTLDQRISKLEAFMRRLNERNGHYGP